MAIENKHAQFVALFEQIAPLVRNPFDFFERCWTMLNAGVANVFNITVDSRERHKTKTIALHVRFMFFCDNKRNVEQMLKQSLNAFKLIQHRFNFNSTSFKTVSRGVANGFDIALQQNPMDVEAVCSGLNLPCRVNSHVRMCSCNMSLKHVPAAFSCVWDCSELVPTTFPRYTALSVCSTRFCRCYMSQWHVPATCPLVFEHLIIIAKGSNKKYDFIHM